MVTYQDVLNWVVVISGVISLIIALFHTKELNKDAHLTISDLVAALQEARNDKNWEHALNLLYNSSPYKPLIFEGSELVKQADNLVQDVVNPQEDQSTK